MAAEDDITSKFKGDVSDLLAAIAEAKAAMAGFSESVKKSSDQASKSTKGAGKDFDEFAKKTSKGAKGAGKDVDDFARLLERDLKSGETATQLFTQKAEALRTKIKQLKADIDKGHGNASNLFGDLGKTQADLRKVESILSQIGESAGTVAGEDFAASFTSVLFSPLGAGIAAITVPIVVSALSAAVTAGVGLGVIGAAAMIQRNNPLIKSAFGVFKDDAIATFKDASTPMVQPFVDAIGTADQIVTAEGPKLKAMFSAAAPAVGLITKGLGVLVDDLLPPLTADAQAFSDALKDPAVQAGLRGTASSAAHLFQVIGSNPQVIRTGFESITTAVTALNDALATTIKVSGGAITALDKTTSGLKSTGAGNPVKSGKAGLTDKKLEDPFAVKFPWDKSGTDAAKASVDAFNGSVQRMTGNVHYAIGATYGEAAALDILYQSMTKTFNVSMTLDEANLNAAQGMADLTSSIKANHNAWSLNTGAKNSNTQAARNNTGALLSAIQADKAAYDAQVAATGATAGASKKYDAQVDKLLALARQAGLSKSAIAKLKAEYESIPASRTLTFKIKITGSAGTAGLLGQHTVSANSNIRTSGMATFADSGVAGGRSYGDSGATGLYAGRNGGLYRFAERSTGVEALISRGGDPGRGLAATAEAARWFGAHIAPGRSMASGIDYSTPGAASSGGPTLVHAVFQMDGKTIVDAITPAAQRRGHRNAGVTGLG